MLTFAKINGENLWSKTHSAQKNISILRLVNHDLDGFAASEDHI